MYTLTDIVNKTAGSTQKFFVALDKENNPTDWVIALDWEGTVKTKIVLHMDTAKLVKDNAKLKTLSFRTSVKNTVKGEEYNEVMVFIPKTVETFLEA